MNIIVRTSLLVLVISLMGCSNEPNSDHQEESTKEIENTLNTSNIDSILTDSIPANIIEEPCFWDDYLISEGLVNILDIDSSILVDLKYSTEDNFMELDVYGCLSKCYLQPDVAERIKLCQQELLKIDSNLSLLIYDGLRPRLVQQYMWDLLDMPLNDKVKFISNPAKGSLHNFGAAVDITIYNKTKQMALDMGTPYDYIGVLAWPSMEPSLLKDSLLTQEQVDNRILLRKVMKVGKFFNIQTEWWHFNACYRDKALELYHIIEGDSNFIFTQK
ncbi:MAG: M15 family metallopeptidase [Flavobacteriales bacterium]|nr:M15 family metallopeptidase [Flavobacteriales bacterium]